MSFVLLNRSHVDLPLLTETVDHRGKILLTLVYRKIMITLALLTTAVVPFTDPITVIFAITRLLYCSYTSQ
jgi:hypothetical protein